MLGSSEEMRETILVVDGDKVALDVVVAILEHAKFNVLFAHSAADAIKMAADTDRVIHLLLSELDAPGMSGPDLGEFLKADRPDLRVMLMSESDDGNLLVLNYGWAYIQKLMVPAKLVEMIAEVLRAPDRSQVGGQEFDSAKDHHRTAASRRAAVAPPPPAKAGNLGKN